MKLHVDLCCGLGGWQAPFREADNWRTVGLDVRRDVNPDVQADVRHLPIDAVDVALVTASPPCTEFSKWDMPFYDDDDVEPSLDLLNACLDAIEYLNPQWHIVENVRGMHLYWRQADKVSDPWYFWGRFPPFDFEPQTKSIGDMNALRNSWESGGQRGLDAAQIPYHVADALRRAVEWSG